MPRTAVPVQTIANQGSIASIMLTAADAVNNHEAVNDGKTVFLLKNTSGSGIVVTFVSVTDSDGRTGDLAVTVPATTGISMAGPFKPTSWNQSGAPGKININVASSSGLSLAAVQLSS